MASAACHEKVQGRAVHRLDKGVTGSVLVTWANRCSIAFSNRRVIKVRHNTTILAVK